MDQPWKKGVLTFRTLKQIITFGSRLFCFGISTVAGEMSVVTAVI